MKVRARILEAAGVSCRGGGGSVMGLAWPITLVPSVVGLIGLS